MRFYLKSEMVVLLIRVLISKTETRSRAWSRECTYEMKCIHVTTLGEDAISICDTHSLHTSKDLIHSGVTVNIIKGCGHASHAPCWCHC